MRIVLTHSTYVDGLVKALQALPKDKGIATVTPGVLKRIQGVKGTSGNTLSLKVTVPLPVTGSFKVLAKRGTSCQEVFITSSPALTAEELQAVLDRTLTLERLK